MKNPRGSRSTRRAVLGGAAAFGPLCVGGLHPRNAHALHIALIAALITAPES